MPEMNGFEATHHVRTKMQLPKSAIPIIALTADVTKADVDKCAEIGMNEYVSKPINENDLLNKIANVLKKKAIDKTEPINEAVTRLINLDYLKSHSPNNPKFVVEMVNMLLTQTPVYLAEIEKSLAASDWSSLHGNIHKIRPSIDLIGMPKDISNAAKQVEEYCKEQTHLDLIPGLILKVSQAFHQALKELEQEITTK